MRALVLRGLAAALVAVVATALVAALARVAGADLEVSGGEEIPVSGIAVVTGFSSLVGVVLAAALLRWSARPADRFVAAAVTLTAISLVPPVLAGADAATVVTLVVLHLVAAAVVVPVVARTLRESSRVGSGTMAA
jgi:hypothetical protein